MNFTNWGLLHLLLDIGEHCQLLHQVQVQSSIMDFFIMWLCFYTYCILALYFGSRRQLSNCWQCQRSENPPKHKRVRQVRQEYLQTIQENTFESLPENNENSTIMFLYFLTLISFLAFKTPSGIEHNIWE